MTESATNTDLPTKVGTSSWLVRDLSVTTYASLIVIMAYAAGYLIHATYMRSIGIGDILLINSQYLEIGLMFLVLSSGILVFPYIYLAFIQRDKERLPFSPEVIRGGFFPAVNYWVVMLFIVIFAGPRDRLAWTDIPFFGHLRLASLMNLYLISTVIGILWIGLFRAKLRWRYRMTDSGYMPSYRNWHIGLSVGRGVIHASLVSFAIIFDYLVIFRSGFVSDLIFGMRFYLITLIFVGFSLYYIKHLAMRVWSRSNEWKGLGMGLLFSVVILYILIVTYAFGVYPEIPDTRGGQRLDSVKILGIDPTRVDLYRSLIDINSSGAVRTIPLRCVAATQTRFYVVKNGEQIRRRSAQIYIIKKDDVTAIQQGN